MQENSKYKKLKKMQRANSDILVKFYYYFIINFNYKYFNLILYFINSYEQAKNFI